MSKPGVFIIESLDFDDEEYKRYEGKFLSHILKLQKIEFQYFYIRTKAEFKEVLNKFYDSDFRYLHISSHGDSESIALTLENINHDELCDLLEVFLYKKRLFLSACSATNFQIAEKIILKSGCLSVIGPSEDIEFGQAAIIWASFYHLVFKTNNRRMSKSDIIRILKRLVKTFEVNMNYYSNIKGFEISIKEHKIVNKSKQ